MTFLDFYGSTPLEPKIEVFPEFQEFKNLVEAQCKQNMKCLQFDREGQYIGNAFK